MKDGMRTKIIKETHVRKKAEETKETISSCIIESPAGHLELTEMKGYLSGCTWTGRPTTGHAVGLLGKAKKELEEYFSGIRKEFDIPLAVTGTDFQKQVWNAILEIPYGKTMTYEELAKKIGLPRNARPAANACGANPAAIFIPCHRVVGSSDMGGYTGGTDKKLKLFAVEGIKY